MWTKDELQISPERLDADGRIHHVTPETAKWEYTHFDVHQLEAGQKSRATTKARRSAPSSSAALRDSQQMKSCSAKLSTARRRSMVGLGRCMRRSARHGRSLPYDRWRLQSAAHQPSTASRLS